MTEQTLTRSIPIQDIESHRGDLAQRYEDAMLVLWPDAKITRWYDMSMDALNVTARWETPE